VMVLIVVFAWRYKKGRGATYDPNFDHSTMLELAIWSAPLLIIIALGALTWSSTHLLDPFRPLSGKTEGAQTTNQKPLLVQVVSLDWKWLFIYPEQGIGSVNELAIPVDRPVRFEITSSNMMNTFYAPTLAGMVYSMPGMQSEMQAILRKAGDYDGYSGNYSGAGFSYMHFVLKGFDDGGFSKWIADAKSSRQSLMMPDYMTLAKPSERAPIEHYARVEPDLYRRILERCVDPGSTCMSQTMAHDMKGHAMPETHGSTQPDKADGALMKKGDVQETGSAMSDHNRDAPEKKSDEKPHGHD